MVHGKWDVHMGHKLNNFPPGLHPNSSRPSLLPVHEFPDFLDPHDLPHLNYPSNSGHSRPLSWRKRVYEFFSAPVTRFYLHVVSKLLLFAFFPRVLFKVLLSFVYSARFESETTSSYINLSFFLRWFYSKRLWAICVCVSIQRFCVTFSLRPGSRQETVEAKIAIGSFYTFSASTAVWRAR